MSRHIDAAEAAYQAEHPEVDWATHDVTFTMAWLDRSQPPVFEAAGHQAKANLAALRIAVAKAGGIDVEDGERSVDALVGGCRKVLPGLGRLPSRHHRPRPEYQGGTVNPQLWGDLRQYVQGTRDELRTAAEEYWGMGQVAGSAALDSRAAELSGVLERMDSYERGLGGEL